MRVVDAILLGTTTHLTDHCCCCSKDGRQSIVLARRVDVCWAFGLGRVLHSMAACSR